MDSLRLLLAFTFIYSSYATEMYSYELCTPRPTLISIDKPNYQFFPYIVKLHRCGGSCSNVAPTVQKCIATQTQTVTKKVYHTGQNKLIDMKLVNHTHCGCKCVIKPSDCNADQEYHQDSCKCRCKYRNTSPKKCPEGFRWNSDDCGCICHRSPKECPIGKSWNTRECGCKCKAETVQRCRALNLDVNEECECTTAEVGANTGIKPQDNPKVSKLTFLLMAGEFVILCIIFDAILCRWKTGVTYSLVKRLQCRAREKDINTGEVTVVGKDNITEISSTSTRDCSEQV